MPDFNTFLGDAALDDIDLLLDQANEIHAFECNAATDFISYALDRESVAHKRMCGSVKHPRSGTTVFPHCWIELSNGQILDVRLARYFPYSSSVPHGRFDVPSHYLYTGDLSIDDRLEETLLKSLAAR